MFDAFGADDLLCNALYRFGLTLNHKHFKAVVVIEVYMQRRENLLMSFSLSIRTWWSYTKVTVPTTSLSGDSQVSLMSSSRIRSRKASDLLV